MNDSERRQRVWDAVYSAVFANLWPTKVKPVMPEHYAAALAGVSSDSASAADDAIKQLDVGQDWGPKDM